MAIADPPVWKSNNLNNDARKEAARKILMPDRIYAVYCSYYSYAIKWKMYTFLEIGYLVRVNTADMVSAKHHSPSFATKPVDI